MLILQLLQRFYSLPKLFLLSLSVVVFLLSWWLSALQASAQDFEALKSFKDWKAQSYMLGKNKRCAAYTTPKKAAGKYKKRGDIWAFILHHPRDKAFNEVSFEMGYTVKAGSTPVLAIGKEKFSLFADGETVFAFPEDERNIIAAMKQGSRMIIRAVSSRGTKTTDTYSLSGVSAALKFIDGECR